MHMKIIICCSLLILCNVISAQSSEIEKLSVKEILYKDVVIPFDRSENIFRTVPEAHKEYLKAHRSFKTAKTFGYSGLAVFGISVLVIAVDNNDEGYCDTICLTTGDAIGIVGIALATPTFGIFGMIAHLSGISKQNKSIKYFNNANQASMSMKAPILQFSFTKNGMGFVLNF